MCDDFTRIGCKNANKNVLVALSVLAFGLTIVGLAWNEPVCLNVNGIRVKNLE